jgi:undecaprenyl-diphosphatase
MEALNRSLFLWINAGEHPPQLMVWLATAVAQWLVVGLGALLLVLWLWGRRASRAAVLVAVQTLALGMACNLLIGFLFMHPRPFMIPLGHTYLAHAPETSFPSDHAVVFFAVGLALCMYRRALGSLVVVLGVAVGAARVYLGVHFPFDIVGALLVAIASYWLVVALLHQAPLQGRLLDGLEVIYRRLFGAAIARGWVQA